MKIGFIRALFGACSGAAAFEKLSLQSKWRSFGHLILMCLLVTLLTGVTSVGRWYRQVKISSNLLAAECGALYWQDGGIVPELSPEKSRSFLVAGPLSVTYLAENDNVLPEEFRLGCNTGLIWSGAQVGVWKLLSDQTFEFTAVTNDFSIAEPEHAASAEDLVNILRKSKKLRYWGNEDDAKASVMTSEKIRVVGVVVIFLMVILLFLGTVVQTLMYIGMFTGVFALMSINRERKVKVGKMFVLAIYAGFPAMLIGCMAELVNLRFLDYHTIYVFGMTIYLMFVMNYLERKRQTGGY